jgi:hypothetical protein
MTSCDIYIVWCHVRVQSSRDQLATNLQNLGVVISNNVYRKKSETLYVNTRLTDMKWYQMLFELVNCQNRFFEIILYTSVFMSPPLSGPIKWPGHIVLPMSVIPKLISCHQFFPLCFEILTWYLVCGCIMINYRSTLCFVPVQWFLFELWPLDFEILPNI